MTDYLANAYPTLAQRLPKTALADLPTPVSECDIEVGSHQRTIAIKHDNQTSSYYGGNKLRKLEYLLQRAIDKRADRVATFGTVGSNHALATALYARQLELGCTCMLSHQVKTAGAAKVLGLLLQNDAEIVRYSGNRHARVEAMRQHVQGRNTWVIPLGGSSWLGAVGYVNAGLELAAQISAGEMRLPERIYIATGTMGSAVGLALGLALAGVKAVVQAVRVSPDEIMNRSRLDHLLNKTAAMMHRLDPSIPADVAVHTHIEIRHEFFGDGYAKTNAATDAAIKLAANQLGLLLEPTYTGKAMAALLHDIEQPEHASMPMLFWNTYNSNPMPVIDTDAAHLQRMPEEFLRYLD